VEVCREVGKRSRLVVASAQRPVGSLPDTGATPTRGSVHTQRGLAAQRNLAGSRGTMEF
jgi:hypothetical protein